MVSSLHSVTTAEVREALIERSEIALLDVREEGPFAEAHPLFAASLPLGRLELEIGDRVPRRSTRVVVYDNGEGLNTIAVCCGTLRHAHVGGREITGGLG